MALRNILVAYNGSPSSDAALAVALYMQRQYGTHITGLMAMHSRLDVKGQPWLTAAIRTSILDLDRAHVREVEEKFHANCASADSDKTHWIERRADANSTVSEYAQMFDLTVVGRRDSVFSEERSVYHPDRIALKSGRPVLVVPQTWAEPLFADHAVLAWDGNRSATRVLNDAMPLLEAKRRVTVLSIAGSGLAKPLDGIDVTTVLTRHGIAHQYVVVDPGRKSVGETLLHECESRQAGLLVMGAYEHSKFREDIFGGVTATVLETSPIPMLLSH